MNLKVINHLLQEIQYHTGSKVNQICIDGEKMSDRDRQIFIAGLHLMYFVWFDSLVGLGLHPDDIKASMNRWISNVVSVDVREFIDTLEAADALLIRADAGTSYTRFKAELSMDYPHVGEIIAPLRKLIAEVLDSNLGKGIKVARTCLLFLSKLTLFDYSRALEDSVKKYTDTLDRVACNKAVATEAMKEHVAKALSHVDPFRDFCPKHGNGSVAEKRETSSGLKPLEEVDKWQIFYTPAVRYTLIKSGIKLPPMPYHVHTNRMARLSVVPKGLTKKRIICMEPTNLMFLEQGFAGALDFGKTLYSSHVNLQHAELNAELAREASITREYDTHDLSSASDSVTRRFVFSLFEKNKNWLKALRLASTTMVDGSAIGLGNFKPEFFAPMGSALCFPIEVIVFCELCEEAIRRLGRTEKKYRRYRVYGDDIIVHRDVTPYLLELFQEYGFIANESKSFYGDEPFRESCGGHYLNGADAIPIQVGRKFVGFPTDLRRHPEAILELIALANSLQDVSESSRKLIIHHLRKHLDIRLGVLFTGDLLDSSRIHSWNPSNYAAPYYYDKDLQKTVNLGGHLSSPESFHLAGEQGLWAWLCTAERRNNVSDSDQRIVFDNRSQWEATRIRTMSDGSRPRICLPD